VIARRHGRDLRVARQLRQPVLLASVLKPFGIRSASSASGAFAGRARYSRLRRIGTLAPPVSRWLQTQPKFSQSDHFMVCFTAQVIETRCGF
jgi:hypothetical protein